jgi:Holliday junction resolvase-like predicted endonuclease
VKGDDDRGSMEIDILVENGNEIVAIEVKSHLEIRNVKRFLEVSSST